MPSSQPSITIPSSAKPAISLLARMPDGLFRKLLGVISSADPQLSTQRFASKAIAGVPEFQSDEYSGLMRELFNIQGVSERFDLEPAETGRLIASSEIEGATESVPLTDSERKILAERIAAILASGKGLIISSKASTVIASHDRIFLGAKVFSDIRPVFDEDAEQICAAAAVHTLSIHFCKDGDHQDFYVALDDSDLLELKAVIERAEAKALLLKALTDSKSIPYLSP